MTDGNEYLIGAEKYESTIRLLNGLPKGLDRCRQILESHEDIEDDSAEDNEMSVVVQDMILIAEALESIEESEGFENLIDTPIGADLQSSMDNVQGLILEYGIFSDRDDHECCSKALEVLDIVSRLLGEEEGEMF